MPGSSGYSPGDFVWPPMRTTSLGWLKLPCNRNSSSSGPMTRSRPASLSNTMIRSRGMSSTSFAPPRCCKCRGQIDRQHRYAPLGDDLAAYQHVMHIRVGLELVERMEHIGKPDALAPGDRACCVDMAFDDDSTIQRRLQPQDTQRIAIAHGLRAPGLAEIGLDHHALAIRIDASQRPLRAVGLRSEPACNLHELGDAGLAAQLINGRPLHLAADRDGGADRRNENGIARAAACDRRKYRP